MPSFKLDVFKGMDSSVVRGMSDAPYRLVNVVNHRNGGYTAAPTGEIMLTSIRAFKQFSYSRYAYVRTDNGSAALYDIQTRGLTLYNAQGYSDLAVYGDRIVTSGSFVNETPPRFGLGLQSIGNTGGQTIPPADRIFSEVPTRAFDLKMAATEVIPDIRMTVECVPASGYTVAPTTPYDHYVVGAGVSGFPTGLPHVITVYFVRVALSLGTVINPGNASSPYLAPMLVLWVPSEPRDAGGNPIKGEFTLRFTFTGVPAGYEAVFYGTAQQLSRGGSHARMIASRGVNAVGDTPVLANETVAAYMNGYTPYAVWLTLGAGTMKGVLNPPATREWRPGDTYKQDGIEFQLLGNTEDNDYYPSSSTLDPSTLYYHLLQRGGLSAPLYLMAEYRNKLGTSTERFSSNASAFYWAKLESPRDPDGSYTVRRRHTEPREENPALTTFFPMGTKAVSSGGRVWVAADYVITTGIATTRVQDRHTVTPLNYVQREYANNGRGNAIRTVYYSEPNQPLDFRENFLIPPLRKSHTITALAAISSGVVVFGNADACLISGDSRANFQATTLDIPGTLNQATVGTYKSSIIYANEEGLYILDGGTPTLLSDPVAPEWETPISLSVNAKAGTVLVSFENRPSLHYDIRRKDWAIWNIPDLLPEDGYALPVEQDFHVAAVSHVGGLADVYSFTGQGASEASAYFRLDAGSPDTRKQFEKVSYRKEGAYEVTLDYAASGQSYKESSSRFDPDVAVMMHRINVHSNALDLRLRFGGDAVIGGPLVIEAGGVRDAKDIKET